MTTTRERTARNTADDNRSCVDAILANLPPAMGTAGNQTREQILADEVRRLRGQLAERDARWGQLRAKLGDISDDAEAMHSRTLEQYYSGVIQACDDVRDWLGGAALATPGSEPGGADFRGGGL